MGVTDTEFVSQMPSSGRTFHTRLKQDELQDLSHKNFAPETMKKVKWVTKIYREWPAFQASSQLETTQCDLDNVDTITYQSLLFALCRFITEVKKVDGSDFPGKTLYDILV